MTSITPRVRCGLPTNPREWLLDKKRTTPWKGGTTNPKNLASPDPPPRLSVNTTDTKSPIIEEEFEDLIECYSALDEHYWRSPSTTSNSSIPLEELSLQEPFKLRTSSLEKKSYPSDRSSSISEGSHVSILSNASGKSERRKKRIFPGLFVAGVSELPLSINPNLSSRTNLSETSVLSDHLSRPKKTFDINVLNSHPPSSTHRTGEHDSRQRGHVNNQPNFSHRNGHSEPGLFPQLELPNTALRESESRRNEEEEESNNYWDELEVLEAYSTTIESEPTKRKLEQEEEGRRRSSRDSYSTTSGSGTGSEEVEMKFNLTISVSDEKFSDQDQDLIQLATYNRSRFNSVPSPSPLSARSDLSRYSVESG